MQNNHQLAIGDYVIADYEVCQIVAIHEQEQTYYEVNTQRPGSPYDKFPADKLVWIPERAAIAFKEKLYRAYETYHWKSNQLRADYNNKFAQLDKQHNDELIDIMVEIKLAIENDT